MSDTTAQELKNRKAAGTFDPAQWNWCVSQELRSQPTGGYNWEWSVWIMGTGAEQCYGIIWCADEAEARSICREFGIEKPLNGAG